MTKDFWDGYVPEPDKRQQALDRMADNARELGLDYEPAQQEPFGYFRYDLRLDAWVQNRAGTQGTPFYTSPPAQRTWVGLNDTDLAVCGDQDDVLLARYWERVCREKNT